MIDVHVTLLPSFETLDVSGPVGVFGFLKDRYLIEFFSESGGLRGNDHNVRAECQPLNGCPSAAQNQKGSGQRSVHRVFELDVRTGRLCSARLHRYGAARPNGSPQRQEGENLQTRV